MSAPAPEFSRTVKVRHLPARPLALAADTAERAALAERFGLPGIDRLEAEIALTKRGEAIEAHGRIVAEVTYRCSISGEDFPARIDELLALRFDPALAGEGEPDEEVELDTDDLDLLPLEGETIDLGEAAAQTLALALDPYPEGPNAEAARENLTPPEDTGPFAALKALKEKPA